MKDSELRILCVSICLISQMGLLRPREVGLPHIHKASQCPAGIGTKAARFRTQGLSPVFLCHRALRCELRQISALWFRGAFYRVPGWHKPI